MEFQLVFFVAFAIILSSVMFVIMKSRSTKQKDNARAIAPLLGLELLEGVEAEAIRWGTDASRDKEVMTALSGMFGRLPPALVELFKGLKPWALRGENEGIKVAIFPETRSSGKNSTVYTIVRAYYREPLAYELKVAKEGFFTKLGKALFGLEDLEIGDAEFDPAARVKTGDPLQAKLLLGRPEVKRALLDLLASNPFAFATRDRVQWERAGEHFGETELRSALDLVTAAARAISGR